MLLHLFPDQTHSLLFETSRVRQYAEQNTHINHISYKFPKQIGWVRMPPPSPLERHLLKAKEELILAFQVEISQLKRRIDNLETPSRLPPIASPVRGVDFAREPNVTALMRAAIESNNSSILNGQEKYIQFPDDVSDKKLNTDAKDSLGVLMLEHIGPNFGDLSWSKASKSTHVAQCESVIKQAEASRDFIVYRQSSNLWCIRWLAEQRMKSKKSVVRGIRGKKKPEPICVPEVKEQVKHKASGNMAEQGSPVPEKDRKTSTSSAIISSPLFPSCAIRTKGNQKKSQLEIPNIVPFQSMKSPGSYGSDMNERGQSIGIGDNANTSGVRENISMSNSKATNVDEHASLLPDDLDDIVEKEERITTSKSEEHLQGPKKRIKMSTLARFSYLLKDEYDGDDQEKRADQKDAKLDVKKDTLLKSIASQPNVSSSPSLDKSTKRCGKVHLSRKRKNTVMSNNQKRSRV